MAHYRKRPVVIEAEHFDGSIESAKTIIAWIQAGGAEASLHVAQDDPPRWYVVVRTLEGPMRTFADSYVIRGVEGEFYPCVASVFAATYSATSGPDPQS